MFGVFKKLFGDSDKGKLKPLYIIAERINALEPAVRALPSEAFREKTEGLKRRLGVFFFPSGEWENKREGEHPTPALPSSAGGACRPSGGDPSFGGKDGREYETLDDILPEAFALVREAATRTLHERHFDVQLIGGVVLHRGGISEMRTGEGKTLVATLPAYLNALSGKGVHIVTVNDYLSRRDAVWMGQIYHLLGMSVGVINHDSSFLYDPSHVSEKSEEPHLSSSPLKRGGGGGGVESTSELDRERDTLGSFKVVHEFLRPCTRMEAYAADITYGTNNEFGFDYLRDNLEYSPEGLRQKDFNYAIVDEIDSILIDEARTPLIISAPAADSENLYGTFARIAVSLSRDADFKVDEKLKAIQLTPAGIAKAEKALGVENLYTEKGIKYVHHLETAIRAKALFERDKEYVVKDGEVIIVDEFTGRLQPGRRWSEGLHQAIEAKEGVAVQKESRTMASITFQNYFRMYKKLSGMTGTAKTSSEEFYKVYGLEVVSVPTNKPSARDDRNDLIFQTEAGKFKALARQVRDFYKNGQPVLIGTVSIEKNELLSAYLKTEGVPHETLNAKNHEREGAIIAQAGRKSAVTVATNMAGRGVDIKLGGNPATREEYEEVKRIGGLVVLGTERHEARRIDNQLRGRSGRQGDPGATQFFVSLEDALMRVFASDTIKRMMGRFGIPEDEPVENRIITRSLETAQTKIEGFHFDARKHVLEYDDVLNHQRKIIYERRRKILLGGPTEIDGYLSASQVQVQPQIKKEVQVQPQIGKEVEPELTKAKHKQLGANFYPIVQRLILQVIDMFWVEHLEVMDYLRSSVNLRAYGQRDPLVEYKREGLRMFKEMEAGIEAQIAAILPQLGLPAALRLAQAGGQIAEEKRAALQEVHEPAPTPIRIGVQSGKPAQLIGSGGLTSNQGRGRTSTGEKLGRNDPCYCGSGNKYKRCHGK